MDSRHIEHFLLTRFNLLLWHKDKEGNNVRSKAWLDHRFRLFEQYCFPSIANQTCKSFEWIVLFDIQTPDRFKKRIVELQAECSQFRPVFVETERGRFFAEIFREIVKKSLKCNDARVLTTYLDNDDALDFQFVEDIQRRALELPDKTFIYYTQGYQFFTDHKYAMRIRYPRNHFVSIVEGSDVTTIKTIYGYGSHYYIDKIPGARIEYISNKPMWCEVIHEKNMGNDAYFLRAKMVKDKNLLRRDYGLQDNVVYGPGIYLFHFLPRYIKTFVRRCKIKLRGYRFE